MANHYFKWVNQLFMAISNTYVSLPEGGQRNQPLQPEAFCQRLLLLPLSTVVPLPFRRGNATAAFPIQQSLRFSKPPIPETSDILNQTWISETKKTPESFGGLLKWGIPSRHHGFHSPVGLMTTG